MHSYKNYMQFINLNVSLQKSIAKWWFQNTKSKLPKKKLILQHFVLCVCVHKSIIPFMYSNCVLRYKHIDQMEDNKGFQSNTCSQICNSRVVVGATATTLSLSLNSHTSSVILMFSLPVSYSHNINSHALNSPTA